MKKKNLYLILFLLVLYVGVFLSHDSVFIEVDFLINTQKVTTIVSDSNQAGNASTLYLSIHHKCPFCDGFINDADIQEIIRVDLFKTKIRETAIPPNIVSLLIGNPARAPPTI